VRAAAQRLACEHGAEVVMVDHLHLIDPGAGENREREISTISAELKWCWKELGVCGVEAAQLNRKGGDERPWLDNLRDSGTLEADGDTVILLHREDYYRKSDPGYTPDGVLEAIVAKNKSGATGTVPLAFDESRQRITDPSDARPVVETFDYGAIEGAF
jgi:replicative DNA helicase